MLRGMRPFLELLFAQNESKFIQTGGREVPKLAQLL